MSAQKTTEKRISDLRNAGYSRIDGLFIDIPVETSIKRTEARHRLGHDQYRAGEGLGGRYLPPEVIQRQIDSEWSSRNRRTFESVKHNFNDWSIYDNSTDGRRAVLRESSNEKRIGPRRGASSMSTDVTELIVALQNGSMTLEEVADRFRERSWPRRNTERADTYLDLAASPQSATQILI